MASFERAELDEWVQNWLQANKDCEKAGDWRPLADFYTADATYGWNIGPKEDVMCVGVDEIRDVALGLEMEGLENWVYEYQKVLIDEKQGEIVGFWKQIVNKTDGTQDEIYGIGGSWFRLNADKLIEWQRDFFDFGHVAKMFGDLIESGDLSERHAEADRTQHGRREAPRLLPAGPGPGTDLVTSRPVVYPACLSPVTHGHNGPRIRTRSNCHPAPAGPCHRHSGSGHASGGPS